MYIGLLSGAPSEFFKDGVELSTRSLGYERVKLTQDENGEYNEINFGMPLSDWDVVNAFALYESDVSDKVLFWMPAFGSPRIKNGDGSPRIFNSEVNSFMKKWNTRSFGVIS